MPLEVLVRYLPVAGYQDIPQKNIAAVLKEGFFMKSRENYRRLLLTGSFGSLLCWVGDVLFSLFSGGVHEKEILGLLRACI